MNRIVFWFLFLTVFFFGLGVVVGIGEAQLSPKLPSYQIIESDPWKITAYCPKKCCTKKYSDGNFASGKKVYKGGVAVNWLPFGTKVKIEGLSNLFTVEDRGATSVFGTKRNPIKALDIFFESHQEAKNFGRQFLNVEVLS